MSSLFSCFTFYHSFYSAHKHAVLSLVSEKCFPDPLSQSSCDPISVLSLAAKLQKVSYAHCAYLSSNFLSKPTHLILYLHHSNKNIFVKFTSDLQYL